MPRTATILVPKGTKKKIYKKNNAMQKFIWDGHTSKIAQQTMMQPIQNGGLTLCHFEIKVNVLKLS